MFSKMPIVAGQTHNNKNTVRSSYHNQPTMYFKRKLFQKNYSRIRSALESVKLAILYLRYKPKLTVFLGKCSRCNKQWPTLHSSVTI